MRAQQPVHVIGGGLAGSEAAWQLSRAGVAVVLHEMRPERETEAHQTAGLAELVCSNSFRSDDAETNAIGLLHAEMAGKKRDILLHPNFCRTLFLPGKPVIRIGYGFAADDDAPAEDRRGSIRVTVAGEGSADPEVLYERDVRLEEDGEWTVEKIRIPEIYHNSKVELCIESSAMDLNENDKRHLRGFVVAAPKIHSALQARRRDLRDLDRATKARNADRDPIKRQLEALGYVE